MNLNAELKAQQSDVTMYALHWLVCIKTHALGLLLAWTICLCTNHFFKGSSSKWLILLSWFKLVKLILGLIVIMNRWTKQWRVSNWYEFGWIAKNNGKNPLFRWGVCHIYEEHLKQSNPQTPSITYDISQLFDFIDSLTDLSCLV